jgi:hypothetical protein
MPWSLWRWIQATATALEVSRDTTVHLHCPPCYGRGITSLVLHIGLISPEFSRYKQLHYFLSTSWGKICTKNHKSPFVTQIHLHRYVYQGLLPVFLLTSQMLTNPQVLPALTFLWCCLQGSLQAPCESGKPLLCRGEDPVYPPRGSPHQVCSGLGLLSSGTPSQWLEDLLLGEGKDW